MTKTEIKTLNKQLDRLEKQLGINTEIEDMTETMILVYGFDFIDEIFYGIISERKRIHKILKKSLFLHMLTSENIMVRNTIIAYFLASGESTHEHFLKKYLEFQRVITAKILIQRKRGMR